MKPFLLIVVCILIFGLTLAHLAASPAPPSPFFEQFSAEQYPLGSPTPGQR